MASAGQLTPNSRSRSLLHACKPFRLKPNLQRYPIDHSSQISKDWNNVFAFTDAMQPCIPIRPYEQKSRTQTIPNPVTTTPPFQLPARASISTNRTHFHQRAVGPWYSTCLELSASQARPAKCKCMAVTSSGRCSLVKTKEDCRPVCGAQPLDLAIPFCEGKTPHEGCGFSC
jgi:hypothetical protein